MPVAKSRATTAVFVAVGLIAVSVAVTSGVAWSNAADDAASEELVEVRSQSGRLEESLATAQEQLDAAEESRSASLEPVSADVVAALVAVQGSATNAGC